MKSILDAIREPDDGDFEILLHGNDHSGLSVYSVENADSEYFGDSRFASLRDKFFQPAKLARHLLNSYLKCGYVRILPVRGRQSSVEDSPKDLAPISVSVVSGSLANERLELLLYGVGFKRSCSALELASRFLCIPLQVEDLPNLSLNLIQEFGIRASHHS